MNIALWVLQIALAWFCIAGGVYQIVKFDVLKKQATAIGKSPRALWALFGLVNVVGGVGLILPAALNIMPNLTTLSAEVIAIESVVISLLYIYHRDHAPLKYSLMMTVLAAIIVYGRWALSPF